MSTPLRELEHIHRRFGSGEVAVKLALLERVGRLRLRTAASVRRFHEVLCFLRAYPDSPAVLRLVEHLLGGFARRPDLRRVASQLQDSGIAGTPTFYSFFHPTAQWLAARWPAQLTVSWPDVEHPERLEGILHLLALYAETPGLDEAPLTVRAWVRRMKRADETDAAFLLRRMAEMPADLGVREVLFEDIGIMFRLAAGPGTPCRTLAKIPRERIHFTTRPLVSGRPDLRQAIRRRPRSVTAVGPEEGRRLIDVAREAMVTRGRDLDAFAYGDPNDVRVVDCGGGLEFVAIGMIPERRLLLEAVYGFLTLRNGVPIGYVLNSALYGSAEVAYNVFDTFRGAEAAMVYGQVLGMLRHLFGSTSFTIYPYQLGGDGNKEGIQSGAWWFYQKLGFRPRSPEAVAVMEAELQRVRAEPRHRSSHATLQQLAAHNLYYHTGRSREDVIGILPLFKVGLAVTDMLSGRFGSDRGDGELVIEREVVRLLQLGSRRGWTGVERQAFARWAPVVATLPGVADWPLADRHELGQIMRAKGGRRESDFVQRFDRHRRLRRALQALASSPG